MPDKPSASDIKKRINALGRRTGDTEPGAVLSALANHEAVVRMLAGKFGDLGEDGMRALLGEMAGLVGDLRKWAEPASKSSEQDAEAPDAPDRGEACDDLSVLAQFDQVKVYIDGASKGNPGPAATGIAITDLEDLPLYEEGRLIGRATNNVAEYRALIRALEILSSLPNPPRAWFFSDSQLLVQQINGAWKIKNPDMQALAMQAQKLRRALPSFQIVHVPRERNRRADEIANRAYKRG